MTELGKVLDPVADKVAIDTVLCVLAATREFPVWALVARAREGRRHRGGRGARRAPGRFHAAVRLGGKGGPCRARGHDARVHGGRAAARGAPPRGGLGARRGVGCVVCSSVQDGSLPRTARGTGEKGGRHERQEEEPGASPAPGSGRGGGDDIVARLDLLLDASGMKAIAGPGDLVAVKLHFGESNETGHVRPRFLRRIVAWLLKQDARPFLTDCNTLYRGARSDSVAHLRAAAEHGFTYAAVGAPVIIADGLHGTSEVRLPVRGRHVQEAPFGAELVKADSILSVAHFKGHEISGFGGAIKNLGMGGASRAGKLEQHSTTRPYVRDGCTACGTCAVVVPGRRDHRGGEGGDQPREVHRMRRVHRRVPREGREHPVERIG